MNAAGFVGMLPLGRTSVSREKGSKTNARKTRRCEICDDSVSGEDGNLQKGQQNRCFSLWLKTELLGNRIGADASSRLFPDERVLCGEEEGCGADAEETAELGGGVAVASGCSPMGDNKATALHGGDSTGRAKQDAPPGRRWRIRRRYFCVLIHVAISAFKYHQLVARSIGAMKIRSFRSSAGSTRS